MFHATLWEWVIRRVYPAAFSWQNFEQETTTRIPAGTLNVVVRMDQLVPALIARSARVITTATAKSSRRIDTSAWNALTATAARRRLSIATFICQIPQTASRCTTKVWQTLSKFIFQVLFWLNFLVGGVLIKTCFADIPDSTRELCNDANYLDCKKCSGGSCNTDTKREGTKCHQCSGADCLVVDAVANLVDCRSSCYIGMNCEKFFVNHFTTLMFHSIFSGRRTSSRLLEWLQKFQSLFHRRHIGERLFRLWRRWMQRDYLPNHRSTSVPHLCGRRLRTFGRQFGVLHAISQGWKMRFGVWRRRRQNRCARMCFEFRKSTTTVVRAQQHQLPQMFLRQMQQRWLQTQNGILHRMQLRRRSELFERSFQLRAEMSNQSVLHETDGTGRQKLWSAHGARLLKRFASRHHLRRARLRFMFRQELQQQIVPRKPNLMQKLRARCVQRPSSW